jgi:hypothetical protein
MWARFLFGRLSAGADVERLPKKIKPRRHRGRREKEEVGAAMRKICFAKTPSELQGEL